MTNARELRVEREKGMTTFVEGHPLNDVLETVIEDLLDIQGYVNQLADSISQGTYEPRQTLRILSDIEGVEDILRTIQDKNSKRA